MVEVVIVIKQRSLAGMAGFRFNLAELYNQVMVTLHYSKWVEVHIHNDE